MIIRIIAQFEGLETIEKKKLFSSVIILMLTFYFSFAELFGKIRDKIFIVVVTYISMLAIYFSSECYYIAKVGIRYVFF